MVLEIVWPRAKDHGETWEIDCVAYIVVFKELRAGQRGVPLASGRTLHFVLFLFGLES